jgi:hypothetical protein
MRSRYASWRVAADPIVLPSAAAGVRRRRDRVRSADAEDGDIAPPVLPFRTRRAPGYEILRTSDRLPLIAIHLPAGARVPLDNRSVSRSIAATRTGIAHLGDIMRRIILASIVVAASSQGSFANDVDLNKYMIDSYQKLLGDRTRSGRGYDLHAFFTRDLNYGREASVIKASAKAPLTMCNAAVTETFVEAINLYATANPSWSPQQAMPTALWNKPGFGGLKSHFFSHSLFEYPPLEKIPQKEIPQTLRDDVDKFHSKQAMAKAVERLGIGQRVPFGQAKPGDILTLARTGDRSNGKPAYGGHSVVFLGFLDRDQKLINRYDERAVVGFKYFSSQGAPQSGLGERWAYFRGFCPVRPGYRLPDDPKYAGCNDRVDNAANRARSPLENPNQPTDCCINKSGQYGPQVGRILSPARWTFATKHPAIEREYVQLQTRIKEFVRNRESSAVRVALLAKGAAAYEASSPRRAAAYINRISSAYNVDLRAVARDGAAPTVTPALANKITRDTPRAIVNAANRRVTAEVNNTIRQQIEAAPVKALADLAAAEEIGIPNSALNNDFD